MWKVWKRDEIERLESLERKVKQLEADARAIELEWENVWTKIRKALGRVTKNEALENAEKNGSNQLDLALERERILSLARATSVR